MKKIRYIEELNYFNGIACLLVILIHVLSIGITSLEPKSWQGFAVFLPWRISQFVVPAFLFSGAVKMSLTFSGSENVIRCRRGRKSGKADIGRWEGTETDGYGDRVAAADGLYIGCTPEEPYGLYLLERCRTILVPYLIFFTIYYGVYAAMHLVESSGRTFFTGLVTGNISGHFYYIIIVIQFYLLKPLWEKMARRVPWQAGMAAALVITAVMVRGHDIFAFFHVNFPYMDRLFPVYLFFWVSGIYAGKYYDRLVNFLGAHRGFVVFSGIAVIFSALAMYIQHVRGSYLPAMNYLKIGIDSLSIAALLMLCIGIKQTHRLKRLLTKINRASYQVYLSHCLFLTVGTIWMQNAGIYRIDQLLLCRMVIGYTVPFALYYLTDRAKRAGQALRHKSL